MAKPIDKDDIKKSPEYHLADEDDEDPETVETRRSVKTVEKAQRHRFFINAKERRTYEKRLANGDITEDEMNFREDQDQELGYDPVVGAEKEAAKKAQLEAKRADDKAKALEEAQLDGLTGKERAKLRKEKEKEDAIKAAKDDTPENAPGQGVPVNKKELPDPKKAPKVDPADADGMDLVDPELAKALDTMPEEGAASFVQRRSYRW